ncbi:hypothetical protein HNQ07_004241 [Deinococcus metalli]|uniref:Uncharacterized protein n=1 Tax=Deinococcus metalli TaxID=1141878 RepID=A0A7W8KLF0_9DEIO|nr:hypothetical protein [Deinococcus metalli]MBB5378734.1 hypothetical protein [Deinococcus metalli]GHF60342.1 hypothetical protein GCM10017781_40640 [Deinococcus metalli]
MVEVTAKGCRRWLLLHVEGESGDVTYHRVVSKLRDAGLVGELASAKSVQRLMGDFPRPIKGVGQHVADQEGRCVVTLNVRQLGDVTQPGMTRALVGWLCQRDHPGYLVMDFHHAGHGVGRCDLALVLTARTDLEGQRAAQEAEVLMFEGLGAVVEQDTRRQAVLRTLKRLLPGSRARARLPACAGNIADLFPV